MPRNIDFQKSYDNSKLPGSDRSTVLCVPKKYIIIHGGLTPTTSIGNLGLRVHIFIRVDINTAMPISLLKALANDSLQIAVA